MGSLLVHMQLGSNTTPLRNHEKKKSPYLTKKMGKNQTPCERKMPQQQTVFTHVSKHLLQYIQRPLISWNPTQITSKQLP